MHASRPAFSPRVKYSAAVSRRADSRSSILMAEKSLFLRSLWLCFGNAAGRIRQATDASDPARGIQSFLQADKRRPACSLQLLGCARVRYWLDGQLFCCTSCGIGTKWYDAPMKTKVCTQLFTLCKQLPLYSSISNISSSCISCTTHTTP